MFIPYLGLLHGTRVHTIMCQCLELGQRLKKKSRSGARIVYIKTIRGGVVGVISHAWNLRWKEEIQVSRTRKEKVNQEKE